MTLFEQYQKVASYITTQWTSTPVFMNGEVIEVNPPYIVIDVYNLGTNSSFSCDENVQGCKVSCYTTNRGKAHKLVSDVHEALIRKVANGLTLEDVHSDSPITKYEDDLFMGSIKFTTRS